MKLHKQKTRCLASTIRRDALRMVSWANASHIGGVLSSADIIAVLYGRILNIRPTQPKWNGRDRFVMSKGHCAAGVYAALAARGFISRDELSTYGKNGSRLMAHVSHKVPGVEFSTGSLGHGLPFACGCALAAKRKGELWRTYVLLSDGELNEGSNWEAILFAPHHKLSNLVAIIDYNRMQSMGNIERVLELEPLVDKFRAFGWTVKAVDGHSHAELSAALSTKNTPDARPKMVIARSVKGKGVDYMENNNKWHYSAPKQDELLNALSQIR